MFNAENLIESLCNADKATLSVKVQSMRGSLTVGELLALRNFEEANRDA